MYQRSVKAAPTVDVSRNYLFFPQVVTLQKSTAFMIRSISGKGEIKPDSKYCITACAMEHGFPTDYPKQADFQDLEVQADKKGVLSFSHSFQYEGEYQLRVFEAETGKHVDTFSLYCVGEDLSGRYPYQGDTHMHTCLSDGTQSPEMLCADYRQSGYDFMAVTDHRRYYPSLRAMQFMKGIPSEMTVVPGEEVHMIDSEGRHNDTHIINFGGEYSINALAPGKHRDEAGEAAHLRSLYGKCPETMSQDAFDALMNQLCEEEFPDWLDVYPAAQNHWIFEQIRKANGLAVFVHPNWINNVYHVPERFVDYMVDNQWFDAFEVCGGENYYEQNGFQTLRYYDDCAKGHRYPVVGATDTHNSSPNNPCSHVASTIVFAKENEKNCLIQAIKDFYSVAVDRISEPKRLVGTPRIARYAQFLLKHYFPLHDELCFEEGRLIRQYIIGTSEEKEEALDLLCRMYGRIDRLRKKYFAF